MSKRGWGWSALGLILLGGVIVSLGMVNRPPCSGEKDVRELVAAVAPAKGRCLLVVVNNVKKRTCNCGHKFDNIRIWKRLEKLAGEKPGLTFIPVWRGKKQAEVMQAYRFTFVHIGDVGCSQEEYLTLLWQDGRAVFQKYGELTLEELREIVRLVAAR